MIRNKTKTTHLLELKREKIHHIIVKEFLGTRRFNSALYDVGFELWINHTLFASSSQVKLPENTFKPPQKTYKLLIKKRFIILIRNLILRKILCETYKVFPEMNSLSMVFLKHLFPKLECF